MLRSAALAAALLLQTGAPAWAQQQNPPPAEQSAAQRSVEAPSVADTLDAAAAAGLPDYLAPAGPNDVMVKILSRIFGSPFTSIQERFFGGSSDFASARMDTALVFIAASVTLMAMLLAGVFLLYITVGTLFYTAQSGEFMGRKWSSWFVSLRLAGAMAFVFPVAPLGGMCLAQAVVLALATLGIGIGGAMWSGISTFLLSNPLTTYEPPSQQIVERMLTAHVCMARLNALGVTIDGVSTHGPILQAAIEPADLGVPQDASGLTRTTKTAIHLGQGGVCGIIAVPAPQLPTEGGLDADARQSALEMQSALQMIQMELIGLPGTNCARRGICIEPIAAAISEDYNAPWSGVPVARKIQLANQVAAVRERYIRAVATAVESSRVSMQPAVMSEASAQISNGGFALAGSYYWILERKHRSFVEAADRALEEDFAMPDAIDPQGESWYSGILAWLGFGGGLTREHIAYLKEAYDRKDAILSMAFLENSSAAVVDSLTGAGTEFSDSGKLNYDPMHELRFWGDVITNASVATIVVASAPGAAATVAGKIPGPAQPVLQGVSGILKAASALAMMILPFGILLGLVIPAMPYAMWILALGGYLISILEAVVAAPFMAAFHAHPDGHDLAGGSSRGYPILMNLLLTPMMMVIGLVVGMVVFRMTGWLLTSTLDLSWAAARTGSMNFLSLFGKIALMAIMGTALAYKSFSLISEFRNSVFNYIGISDGKDLGESSSKMMVIAGIGNTLGQGTTQAVTAATGGGDKSRSKPPRKGSIGT
jgi:hypothetical protein